MELDQTILTVLDKEKEILTCKEMINQMKSLNK